MTDKSRTANTVREGPDNPAGLKDELAIDRRTQVFLDHRGRLFAVAMATVDRRPSALNNAA